MANNFASSPVLHNSGNASSSNSSPSPRLSSSSTSNPNLNLSSSANTNNNNNSNNSNAISNGIKRKNMAEWGYVAQLERLDLERGREDCWVTFKPAKRWDYLAFLRALQTWYNMHGVPANFKEVSASDWTAATASPPVVNTATPPTNSLLNSSSSSNTNNANNNNSSAPSTPRLAIQHKIISAEPIKINSSNGTTNGTASVPHSPRGPSPLVERRMDYKKRREMLPSSDSSSSSTLLSSSNGNWNNNNNNNNSEDNIESTTTSSNSSSSSSSFPLLGVPFSEKKRLTNSSSNNGNNNNNSNSNDSIKCVLDEILCSELSLSFSGNLLGKSNHGYVFKAYWKGLPVAVRFPTLKFPITDIQARDRWVREINRSSKSHPNIVQHYAASTGINGNVNSNSNSSTINPSLLNSSTQLFLVMEYCNMGSLRQYWPMAPVYLQGLYIARIAMDVARAVTYLHSVGIVHTNLKPSSIMVCILLYIYLSISLSIDIVSSF